MGRAVDHNQRREIFAAAALRVIMRDGIVGLTVRAVAKEAGFTTGALTHYFHSKDQLLIEASEHSATLVRDRMERAEKTHPTLDAIRKVVALALPLTPETRGYWRIWVGYWERSSYDDDVARVMRLRYDEWRSRLERLLSRAQLEGDLAPEVDPRQAAEALIALVDGIGVQVLLGVGRISPKRQRAMFDLWLDAIRAGSGGSTSIVDPRPGRGTNGPT
ncbi:TetR family transcriptional regulator [Phenylobacterium sp. LH3H17]|uniref:TetR/AcrR family transcriptional regulator n=1 Tax=Phenylobacterium sp. LH3H17 TaxID=2903901 RepID=UPI0020C9FA8C|nr:TetR/AcrR family transcriptional regulator [Phenylobacterium sp. LH3H17]UTP38209.1 TetR family transcriptional regulator [Phenylobacterium sp. LH3H17]